MKLRSMWKNIMFTSFVGCFMLLISTLTFGDTLNQVARLSYINGTVSFLPAGETQWVGVSLNRPLITNDQIWTDTGALVEMQFPGAAVRMGSQTDLKILNLNDQIAQFQITHGTLVLSIKRTSSQQVYEVDTPNFAFVINEPGYYRFDISTENNMSTVSVRMGQGVAFGINASNTISVGHACSATGTNLENYQCTNLSAADNFGNWSLERDKIAGTVSTQYVSPDTIGYEDLGNYGAWTEDKQYGPVWYPYNVDPNWAPYQNGQWIWLSFWGWTWVDNQPWGFAPFHYGRWAYIGNRWCWVPGPIGERPIYAPALTVFIGGDSPQFKIDDGYSIGWFPLAPGEPYIPPYLVSHNYFTAINQSNTVINLNYINNIYKNQHRKIKYKNAQISNAVTVVPNKDFINARLVNNLRPRLSNQILFNATKTQVAPVVPQSISIFGGKAFTQAPPAEIISRPIIVKTQPSPAIPSFSKVRPFLLKNAGKPLTPEELRTITGKNFQGTQPSVIGKPAIIYPSPGTDQVPGGQPVPKVQPAPNVPAPNVQPSPNVPAPNVQPSTSSFK